MADFFWYNPSGNARWDQTGAQSHWWTGSGGTGTKITANPPTAADRAIFDDQSGAGLCNFPATYTATCLSLLCNGVLGTTPTTTQITSAAGVKIQVGQDISLSANQIFDVKLYPTVEMVGTDNGTISTNGNSFGNLTIAKTGSASVTLNDDLIGIGNAILTLTSGIFDANGKNVTFGAFATSGSTARTLTMGSGTWNMVFESESNSIPITTWNIASTTALTFNKGTATIKMIHASNSPVDNSSLVIGLKNALTSSSTTIDITDITGFPTSGTVLVGDEVIQYVGTNTTTKQLGTTSLTRGYGGTITLASVPAGTAVTGVLLGNSTLAAPMTAGVNAPIQVVDASLYPQSGTIYIGTETIAYTGTNLVNNQLGVTTVGTPTQNHSIGDPVYAYQAKYFVGGGLTYNDVIFGLFGYKTKNYIYGSNTFTNIKNTSSGFTWTATSNVYPGFQELSFEAGQTNIIGSQISFTGTSGFQQAVTSQTGGTQTTLSIIPATSLWNVGTHSVDGGNNTNLYYVAGSTDYIIWTDILALPATLPPAATFQNQIIGSQITLWTRWRI